MISICCRDNDHTLCSGVQLKSEDAGCECICHTGEEPLEVEDEETEEAS